MIDLKVNNGLNNSGRFRDDIKSGKFEKVLADINFEQKFKEICMQKNNREFSDADLSVLLSDIVTHYRNSRDIIHGEDFFK